MVKLELVHEIECDKASFWSSFFDAELSKRLFLEGLGFREWIVTSQTEDSDSIRRNVSVEPVVALPGPLVKLLGTKFRYSEEGTFDKATETFRWKLVPSAMADKIRVEGVMRATPAGEGKTTRRVELTIEASVFMVGKLVEETFAKQLDEGWTKGANVQNEWLRKAKSEIG